MFNKHCLDTIIDFQLFIKLIYLSELFEHWSNIALLILTIQRFLILYRPFIEKLFNHYFIIIVFFLNIIFAIGQFLAYATVQFPSSCSSYTCIVTTNIYLLISLFYIPFAMEILICFFGILFFIGYSLLITKKFTSEQKVG